MEWGPHFKIYLSHLCHPCKIYRVGLGFFPLSNSMNIRVATACCLCKRSDTPTLCCACAHLYFWVLSLSLGGRAQAELSDSVKWLPVRINRIMDTSPQQRAWRRVSAQKDPSSRAGSCSDLGSLYAS